MRSGAELSERDRADMIVFSDKLQDRYQAPKPRRAKRVGGELPVQIQAIPQAPVPSELGDRTSGALLAPGGVRRRNKRISPELQEMLKKIEAATAEFTHAWLISHPDWEAEHPNESLDKNEEFGPALDAFLSQRGLV